MHGRVGVVIVLLEESGPWGLADADFPHTGGAWWGSIPSSVGARRAHPGGVGVTPSEARLAPWRVSGGPGGGACRRRRPAPEAAAARRPEGCVSPAPPG